MKGSKEFTPSKGEVYLGNKISETGGVSKGDSIGIYDNNYKLKDMSVTGICKNYMGKVAYISEDEFKNIFGSDMGGENSYKNTENLKFLVRLNGKSEKELKNLMSDSGLSLKYDSTRKLTGIYATMANVYHLTVYIMIILAACMSVFVLMNLVNIFVSKKSKELIIMGVNGFSYKQQIGYLIRETIVITLSGLSVAVLLGVTFTTPLIKIIESEDLMFKRDVNIWAWIFAVFFEFIFALIINLIAFKKVKKLRLFDIMDM
jgi:putative ABC transport system permease protein